jgi:polyisoprenoid-binding protein YceI
MLQSPHQQPDFGPDSHAKESLVATTTTIDQTLPAGTWRVDAVHSSIGFAVKHMVVSTFRGRFEDYDVTLETVDGAPRLTGTVGTDSIKVKDDDLAAHLAAPDFFDTERFPELTFVSTAIRREGDELIVDGDLTIKGITRNVEARGTTDGPAVTLGDFEKLGIELETVVDRTAFGLEWNAPLPKGGFALANDVKLVVSLELTKE